MQDRTQEAWSSRSYGLAVILCGIFGVVGVHHFYLGNILHGLFDFFLFLVGFGLFMLTSDPRLFLLSIVLIGIDFVHTVVVFFRLIVGAQRDGDGLIVRYPGQT